MRYHYADVNPMGFTNSGEIFAFESKAERDAVIAADIYTTAVSRKTAKKEAGKWPDFRNPAAATQVKAVRIYGKPDFDLVYF